ncbi:MAG: MMPL family transporter [Rhodothermaceae bacterium]|nr:MMPL family transporter [Rhodothermaceae bacterium]
MDRLFQALLPLLRFAVRHPSVVLGAALVLTVVAGWQARTLGIDTDLANLLPSDYPSVQAIERLRDEVGAESTTDVGIESPSLEANKAFAEALIPRAMALRRSEVGEPFFTRVDYRRDLRFIEQNAAYFATYVELDSLEQFVEAQAAAIRRLADGDSAGTAIPSGPTPEQIQQRLNAAGLREYPISPDSTVLGLRFYPAGSQTNVGFIEALYRDLDSLIVAMGPSSFHPQMEVTTAGRLLRQSVEIRAISDDVQQSFGAGVSAVLLVVLLYFLYKTAQARGGSVRGFLGALVRSPVLVLVLGFPLLMSLVWTGGMAALAFGTLNLMTSTLGLVLFGLGIDYGVHFYARYAEERGVGQAVQEAAETTFVSTGQAIAVSAMTTAAALFVLTLADFRGFSEFGWIGGTGIVLGMMAMLLVLPACLSLAERLRLLNLDAAAAPPSTTATSPQRRIPLARTIVGMSLGCCVIALILLPKARFEYDFGTLAPTYPSYEARAERIRPVFDTEGRLRNPAYLLLDHPEEIPAVVSALREQARRDTLILAVMSLQERFPTDSTGARRKLDRLASLRTTLDDPFLQLDPSETLAQLREALTITEPIPLDSVPDFLKRPFTTKAGEVGNFVLVYPAASLSDGRRSMRFARLIGEVKTSDGQTYHAASTSIVAADMLRLMLGEAPRMVGITALLIIALMGLTFRSVRWTVLALTPLVVGLLWMVALMEAFGVALTFYNLVVLPAILGIGNDAGVHLIHRYREEGPGSMRLVLRSTGEHVGVGALTTLIGFAGLLLSFHPGLRSIGLLATLGIGATMAAALVFLPALIQVLENQGWLPVDAASQAPVSTSTNVSPA